MGEKIRVCKSDPSHTETVVIEIDPAAHEYGAWKIIREPTCTIAGEKMRTCKRDDSHKEILSIDIDPAAHDYDAWEVTKESTCSVAGEKTRVCKRDNSHRETVAIEIDPEAHKWDEGKVLKEPNCKESGEKVYTCLYDSKHTKKEAISPDPNAHVLGEWVEPVSSTCERNGVPGHYECKICGTFFDAQKREMTETSLPLLDHEIITKKVKCGCELGSYVIDYCKMCGEAVYRQTANPKAHEGVNVCTGCGLNFGDAYKNYIMSEGQYVSASDSNPAYYRITYNDFGDDGQIYQYQWCYMMDGTIEWRFYDLTDYNRENKNFSFAMLISWKVGDNLFEWSCFDNINLKYMEGAFNPRNFAENTEVLPYTSVSSVYYMDESSKLLLNKVACAALQLLLTVTSSQWNPPEGFGINNFGFTRLPSAGMLHEYTVSSGLMDNSTREGQLYFSCSHCGKTRTVDFNLNAEAYALCAPATSEALHASPLEGETLFQERKFCLASVKRQCKRRMR